jgi:hypothetical protein
VVDAVTDSGLCTTVVFPSKCAGRGASPVLCREPSSARAPSPTISATKRLVVPMTVSFALIVILLGAQPGLSYHPRLFANRAAR